MNPDRDQTSEDLSFRPGFRFSVPDLLILLIGGIGSITLGREVFWAGLVVGFVILHFFLFCNVFRIARIPELIWAGCYVVLAGATLLTGIPGWTVSTGASMGVSTFLVWRETQKPWYHGIYWQRWNPNLPQWWKGAVDSGRRG